MGDAEDFETDMQTIRDYTRAVIEWQTKLVVVYTNALASVETTLSSASPEEATPDVLGTILKSGLTSLEELAVGVVKSRTGADLSAVTSMLHAIWDEVDRAEEAAESLEAGEWIRKLRTGITNAYGQGQNGDALREDIEGEYKQGDTGERGGYIGGIQNELAALRTIRMPRVECIELSMYEAWINRFFDNDCMEGTGTVVLTFSDDETPESATVNVMLGDRIAGALNGIMSGAGIRRIMDLKVVKKVCRGTACMCFEGNNVVRASTNDENAEQFLISPQTWVSVRRNTPFPEYDHRSRIAVGGDDGETRTMAGARGRDARGGGEVGAQRAATCAVRAA